MTHLRLQLAKIERDLSSLRAALVELRRDVEQRTREDRVALDEVVVALLDRGVPAGNSRGVEDRFQRLDVTAAVVVAVALVVHLLTFARYRGGVNR